MTIEKQSTSSKRIPAPPLKANPATPIRNHIRAAIGQLRQPDMDAANSEIADLQNKVEARKAHLASVEAERKRLMDRRYVIVSRQTNYELGKQHHVKKASEIEAWISEYYKHGLASIEGVDARGFFERILQKRARLRAIQDFLEIDAPQIEKHLADELAAIDQEIAAFEKREI